MSSGSRRGETAHTRLLDPDRTALVVANLVPIIGVVVFEWSVLGLLTLYWLELGIGCFWAVVRAVFAGRPTNRDTGPLLLGALNEKRAVIPVPGLDADIRLLTVPKLLVAVPVLAAVWVLVGALLVGPVETVTPDGEPSRWLVGGACGIFIAEGWRTLTGYFSEERFREQSVATALRSVVSEGGTVLVASVAALLVTLGIVTAGGGGESAQTLERAATGPLVGVVLAVRLGTDIADYYGDGRFGAGLWSLLGRGDDPSPPPPESVDMTLTEPVTVLRPPLVGRLVPTAAHVRSRPGPWLVTPFAGLAGAIAASRGDVLVVVGVLAAGVGGPLGLTTLDYWLRYGGVEYRTDGTAVVAVDTAFRTPLWRAESWDRQAMWTERDILDNHLDTSTIRVERADRPTQVPRLPDPAPIVNALAAAPASDGDTPDAARPAGDAPETMTEVAIELLRIGPEANPRYALVSMCTVGAVALIAIVILALFEGSGGAAVVVFAGTTVPLVGLIIYALRR